MRDDTRLQVGSGGRGCIEALRIHLEVIPSFTTQDRFCYRMGPLQGRNLCCRLIPDLVSQLIPA